MSQQINLYNPLFLKQEKHFSARAMLQALGLIAVGLAVFYAYALLRTREAERLAVVTQSQLVTQRQQLAKLAEQYSPQARTRALEAEITRLEAEVKVRRPVVAALLSGELGNTAGFSGFFAAFGRKAMPGVWLTGFSVGEGGNELQVRGRVLHPELVPAYLRSLNGEPAMRGREVTELKLSAKERAAAAQASGPASPRPVGPDRYVEFSFTAPLRAAKPESKGGAS